MHAGGTRQDEIRDVAFTADGGLVLTGGSFVNGTQHDIVPSSVTANVIKSTCSGGNTGSGADMDMFVIRLDSAGAVQWITIIGGPHYERAYAVEIAPNNDIVIAGRAGNCAPTGTAGSGGVVQPAFGGDTAAGAYGSQDGYVARFDSNGDWLWSTYFGGNDNGFIRDMDLDSSGNILVGTFMSASVTLPGWAANAFGTAFQTTHLGGEDSLIAKIAANGSQVMWASRLGGQLADGSQPSIRVDRRDNSVVFYTHGKSTDFNGNADPGTIFGAYPQGGSANHGNLVKLSSAGAHVFTRYLGASGPVNGDTHNLAVHTDGTIYVGDSLCSSTACFTASGDAAGPLPSLQPAPGANAIQQNYAGGGRPNNNPIAGNYPGDGYIAKISSDGATALAATLFGGSYGEGIEGIGVTQSGTVVISGATQSPTMPMPATGAVGSYIGSLDGFVAVLSSDLSQTLYVRYLSNPQDATGNALATQGDRIAVVGQNAPIAAINISFDPRTGPPAPVTNAALGGTQVLPTIGTSGNVDSWLYVFDQSAN